MMRRPRSAPVILVAIPFFAGCLRVQVQPIPAPDARRPTEIRGVVVRGAEGDQRIEFEQLDHVEWTDSTVVLTGLLKASPESGRATTGGTVTRDYPLSTLSGVLVRMLDASRTSILVAAVGVGAIAVATFLLTGKADENTVLGVTSRD